MEVRKCNDSSMGCPCGLDTVPYISLCCAAAFSQAHWDFSGQLHLRLRNVLAFRIVRKRQTQHLALACLNAKGIGWLVGLNQGVSPSVVPAVAAFEHSCTRACVYAERLLRCEEQCLMVMAAAVAVAFHGTVITTQMALRSP